MGKKANTSAIRSKQFKFRTDSLSSLLFSYEAGLFTSSFSTPVFFPSCTDATNHRSRQTRDYAMVPRASKVEASEFFVKSNANTIRGAGNFKQLLESSHVLLQRRKEVRSRMGEREFPLIPFNSKHFVLLQVFFFSNTLFLELVSYHKLQT